MINHINICVDMLRRDHFIICIKGVKAKVWRRREDSARDGVGAINFPKRLKKGYFRLWMHVTHTPNSFPKVKSIIHYSAYSYSSFPTPILLPREIPTLASSPSPSPTWLDSSSINYSDNIYYFRLQRSWPDL